MWIVEPDFLLGFNRPAAFIQNAARVEHVTYYEHTSGGGAFSRVLLDQTHDARNPGRYSKKRSCQRPHTETSAKLIWDA
jgi:hypothetical protein